MRIHISLNVASTQVQSHKADDNLLLLCSLHLRRPLALLPPLSIVIAFVVRNTTQHQQQQHSAAAANNEDDCICT